MDPVSLLELTFLIPRYLSDGSTPVRSKEEHAYCDHRGRGLAPRQFSPLRNPDEARTTGNVGLGNTTHLRCRNANSPRGVGRITSTDSPISTQEMQEPEFDNQNPNIQR